MEIPELVFGLCEAFIKVNILIVIMFTIATKADPKEVYMFFVGLAGIVWITIPLTKYLKKKIK